jgi:hypothetical protein
MRVPRESLAASHALIALALGVLAGCATPPPIQVTWDQQQDLAALRTWDWIDGHAVLVRAPYGDDADIEEQLSALVERELSERGFARSPGDGEVRVAVLMVGVRSYQVFRRARAVQTLHSYHDIGGYEVQGEDVERRPVDRCRVAIYLTGPRQERMIWQAVSQQQYSDGCARHLDDAVADLLAQFPR